MLPGTKSVLDLAKVLRLPRNLYLTLRKRCACHATQTLQNLRAAVPMGPSPNPFRDCSETASVRASCPRWFAHCPEVQFTHSANVSASCYPPARREWIQHLVKALRLPRNLHLTLRKCCESAAPATKPILDLAKVLRLPRNSNLAKPPRGRANGPVSEPVPRPPPYRRRVRGGLRTVRKSNSRTAPTFLHLAILQLEESGSSTLRKYCACHGICT